MGILLPDFHEPERPEPLALTTTTPPGVVLSSSRGPSASQKAADTSGFFGGLFSLPSNRTDVSEVEVAPRNGFPLFPSIFKAKPLTAEQQRAVDNIGPHSLPVPEESGTLRFLRRIGVEVFGESGVTDTRGRAVRPETAFGKTIAGLRDTPATQTAAEFGDAFRESQREVFSVADGLVRNVAGGFGIKQIGLAIAGVFAAVFAFKLLGAIK